MNIQNNPDAQLLRHNEAESNMWLNCLLLQDKSHFSPDDMMLSHLCLALVASEHADYSDNWVLDVKEEGNSRTNQGKDQPLQCMANAMQKIATSEFIDKEALNNGNEQHEEPAEHIPYTSNDVLLGRGGLINKHPGNKRFREEVGAMKPLYKSFKKKQKKTQLRDFVLDLNHSYGRRFMKKDEGSKMERWVEATEDEALRKVSQAFRD